MEYLLAVLPSVLALGAFAAVMKLILNSDRLERKAEAELDAQEEADAAVNTPSTD